MYTECINDNEAQGGICFLVNCGCAVPAINKKSNAPWLIRTLSTDPKKARSIHKNTRSAVQALVFSIPQDTIQSNVQEECHASNF
jgi:hypothetical protein